MGSGAEKEQDQLRKIGNDWAAATLWRSVIGMASH